MDITHNVRTCSANLNCVCVPTGLSLGANGGRKARYVNRDSQNCSQNCGAALILSRCRDSTFPDENHGKLYWISSENATEAGTWDEHGLENGNSKAAGTSQTQSTIAAKAKRSNSLKVRSGKSGHAQPHQLTQKNKSSAKAVNNNGNPIQTVKRSGEKLPSASGQVLGVKGKTEPPKYSSKASSRAWRVKEIKPSNDPSKLSSNMSSSDQVHRDQLSQKSKCSAEAVKESRNQTQAIKKSRNQIPPTPEQEKERKEPSKGPSNFSIKISSVNQVHRGQPGENSKCSTEAVKMSGNQIPPTLKQEKEMREPSKVLSNFPTKTSSSVRPRWCQTVQKSNCSAEAVKKSRNQTQVVKMSRNQIRPTAKQENEKKEPSKGLSTLSTKRSSSDRVHKVPDQLRKYSAEAVENSKNQSAAVKKRTNQLPATPKQVWQVKIKTASSQDSGKTSSKVLQVKKKTSSTLSSKMSSSHTKRRRQRSRGFSAEHYIKWDGIVKLGHNCILCENDLAHSPLAIDKELESDKLPDVAVLPCGHAFHTLCLEQAMPEEQLKDPSCVICASLQ